MSYSIINTWLDDIVQKILLRVKNEYPMHSISSISLEHFSFWRVNNIYDNFWEPTEEQQIIRILEQYIFYELNIDELYELLILSKREVMHSLSVSIMHFTLFLSYSVSY